MPPVPPAPPPLASSKVGKPLAAKARRQRGERGVEKGAKKGRGEGDGTRARTILSLPRHNAN